MSYFSLNIANRPLLNHVLLIVFLLLPLHTYGEPDKSLIVGTKIAPPFVIKNDDGQYEGISIELWEKVAKRLNLDFSYQETNITGLIDGLETDILDVSVAALTLTAERERKIDFTHAYFTSGLAIAVSAKGNAISTTLKALFSWRFLAVLAALVGLLFLVGCLLWLAERRKNSAMFGGSPISGIGSSFWWAAVTMTTVGYGDKTPTTFLGRLIALIWMFTTIIIISSFTAAIATSLTVNRLDSSVKNFEDLSHVRVTSIPGSISGQFLDEHFIQYEHSRDLGDALSKLAEGNVNAVVYDRPILQYLVNQSFKENIQILPNNVNPQNYAIAVPNNGALREQINRELLMVINDVTWRKSVQKYLGKAE